MRSTRYRKGKDSQDDPYDVFQEEPFAKYRKCATPGCGEKVRISAYYCDKCRKVGKKVTE